MKKSFPLTIVLIVLSSLQSAFAQSSNCDDIKKENEYLKKTLNLNKPIKEVKSEDLIFSITKIEGNSKMQTLTIELLVTSKGRNLENFTSRVKSIIDINGTEYTLDNAYIGTEDTKYFAYTNLFRDTPLKCKYIFKGIQPEVKVIKMFNYPFEYHILGTNSFDRVKEKVEFKDLNIAWK